MELRICHLYPDLMNIYGDRGNIIALMRRAAWRGLAVRIGAAGVGERVDFGAWDLVFIGGGQDREQGLVAEDLVRTKSRSLVAAVDDGLPLLAVCGGYQLLGRYYRTGEGHDLEGIGLFDLHTEAGGRRMIGNVVIESGLLNGLGRTVVGFENHSGRTFLSPGCEPLGRVLVGVGNNGQDGGEGAVYKHAVGTYLHGSLLPKNPRLADWLLRHALERRYGSRVAERSLTPLDDTVEERAHESAVRRARQTHARA